MANLHNPNQTDELIDKLIFNKYKPIKKLGEGSFGKIYSAVNIQNNEKFALKMELKDCGQNLLETEAYILCYLKGFGIPKVKSYGFSTNYNIMVMELLGKSLEDLFQEQKKKFSLKTVCMIADQMIERLEFIHNKNIIHRDIKPDNFVMGIDSKSNILYLLDFGLAKKYRSSRTLAHVKFQVNKKLTGTARYASINALRGCEQSRRDDLEAVGYVLMYFLRGSLPWQGLKVDKKEDRYKKIYEKKKATTAEELCAGFPKQFCEYVRYTRGLEYEQNPNYNYLKDLFRSIIDENFEYDLVYDWSLSNSASNTMYKGGYKDNDKEKEKEKEYNNNKIINNYDTKKEQNKDIYIYSEEKHIEKDIMNNENLKSRIDDPDYDVNEHIDRGHMNQAFNERMGTQFANMNATVETTQPNLEQNNNQNNQNTLGKYNISHNVNNTANNNINNNNDIDEIKANNNNTFVINNGNGNDINNIKFQAITNTNYNPHNHDKHKNKKKDCIIF